MDVHLPEELETELRRRVEGTEFETVEAYVLFVLWEVVRDDRSRDDEPVDYDADVEKRLEDLGYL